MQKRATIGCPLCERSDRNEVLDQKNAVNFVDSAGFRIGGKTAEPWAKLSRFVNGGLITYPEIRRLAQLIYEIVAWLGFSPGKL